MSGMTDDEIPTRKPGEPTPREVRARWAERGDVEALWRLIRDSRWDDIDQEETFKLLLRAVEVRGREDPEGFAALLLGQMVGFTAGLVFRSQRYVDIRVVEHARANRVRGPVDLPQDVVEPLLPRTLELQHHLAELLQVQANVARVRELTRNKRLENHRAGDTSVTAPRARSSGKKVEKEGGTPGPLDRDGETSNRIAGYLNGRRPGANGEAHHG